MKIGSYNLNVRRPAIMGILNVTPDSFSDGGRFFDQKTAVDHALKLIGEGADIIDVGGESTRPGAGGVSIDEELRRVIPVIEGIRKKSNCPISIDTMKSQVAKAAVSAGADMINDISAGRFDGVMFDLAAEKGAPICLMHMQGTPRTMQVEPHYDDLIGEIYTFLSDAIDRAVAKGVNRGEIIIDPGIGFGKQTEQNIEIIKNLNRFTKLEVPVLIGTSRKSFIGKMLGLDVNERLEATLATLVTSIERGASILRVHDVAPARRFLEMYLLCR